MAQFDLPLEQLRVYRPDLPVPDDFEEFWTSTLATARAAARPVKRVRVETPYRAVESYDLTFSGYDGQDIRAWLHLPADREPGVQLPGFTELIGYGGGRGLVHQRVVYALAGYAHLVMDSRGMGFGGMTSDTPDGLAVPGHAPGHLTNGIESPETYFFRRLITDGVRAVETLAGLEEVDAARLAVGGGSLGGGLSLAVSGLSPLVVASLIDVPFLCDFPRAIRITARDPYHEVTQYLQRNRDRVAQAERTLSYFDAANLGRYATSRALFSVGLMDDVCPPSTVFAAYNLFGDRSGVAPVREIREYEFNGHEGGQEHQELAGLAWLAEHLATDPAPAASRFA